MFNLIRIVDGRLLRRRSTVAMRLMAKSLTYGSIQLIQVRPLAMS